MNPAYCKNRAGKSFVAKHMRIGSAPLLGLAYAGSVCPDRYSPALYTSSPMFRNSS
jgi:hypothetical protein